MGLGRKEIFILSRPLGNSHDTNGRSRHQPGRRHVTGIGTGYRFKWRQLDPAQNIEQVDDGRGGDLLARAPRQ